MALTPEQIAEFKALGYILVPNLIDPSVLDNWRAQIRAKFGDLSDPATKAAGAPNKTQRHLHIERLSLCAREHNSFNHPKSKPLRSHGWRTILRRDGNLRLLAEPKANGACQSGHICGYLGSGGPLSPRIGDHIYDVEPRGGGTVFWPRSHIKSWKSRKYSRSPRPQLKDHREYSI